MSLDCNPQGGRSKSLRLTWKRRVLKEMADINKTGREIVIYAYETGELLSECLGF